MEVAGILRNSESIMAIVITTRIASVRAIASQTPRIPIPPAFSAAVTATLNYLEQDPEQNIPKAMGLMDKVLPDGWYEGQRAAFRKAIDEKGNWYQLLLKAYQLGSPPV